MFSVEWKLRRQLASINWLSSQLRSSLTTNYVIPQMLLASRDGYIPMSMANSPVSRSLLAPLLLWLLLIAAAAAVSNDDVALSSRWRIRSFRRFFSSGDLLTTHRHTHMHTDTHIQTYIETRLSWASTYWCVKWDCCINVQKLTTNTVIIIYFLKTTKTD